MSNILKEFEGFIRTRAGQPLPGGQAYLCQIPLLTAGMLPCNLEALVRLSGATFPVRSNCVTYDGANPRDLDDSCTVNRGEIN